MAKQEKMVTPLFIEPGLTVAENTVLCQRVEFERVSDSGVIEGTVNRFFVTHVTELTAEAKKIKEGFELFMHKDNFHDAIHINGIEYSAPLLSSVVAWGKPKDIDFRIFDEASKFDAFLKDKNIKVRKDEKVDVVKKKSPIIKPFKPKIIT